jgi:uncharacterized delta-60 repeat protein
MKKLIVATLFVAACGDNGSNSPDAGAGVDSTGTPDTPSDTGSTFTPPQAQSFGLSAAGHDQVQSVAAGPSGSFYAVGYRAADTVATTPKNIVVIKLGANGMPDANFGTAGVLDTQIPFRGGTDELDIVTLADGKLLVSATVAAAAANAADAADTDIALIRITAAGALDNTFGGGDGYVVHNFNTSILNTAPTPVAVGRDAVRGLAVRANGEIFIHAVQRAEGNVTGGTTPRLDTDYLVAKFTAAGELDTTWGGGDGKYLRDIYYNNAHTPATAKGIIVLDDGAVLAGGYASSGITGGPQPVLIRLEPDGTPDGNFGTDGLFHDAVLGWQTEVYNFARHGDKIVTGGYGREAQNPDINNFISLRFDATTGARDTTWGGSAATDGKVLFDPTPDNNESGSNCRNAVALTGGKTLLLGSSNRSLNNSTSPNPMAQDAVFAILDANGVKDTAYGTGVVTYKLGDDGADQFWGAVVSGDNVLIVGWRGTAGTASATNNDDAYRVLLPLK